MDWSRVGFCPTVGKLDVASVCHILSDLLFGSAAAELPLCDWYNNMIRDYLSVHDAGMGRHAMSKEIAAPTFGTVHELVRDLFAHPAFGHDVPIWLKPSSNLNGVRVMMISQDARRASVTPGCLSLGSPFGLHDASYRSPRIKCNNKQVYDLVVDLLGRGAIVYLTDALKFYTADKYVYAHVAQSRGYLPIFREVLNCEIELYQPDIIVTISNAAALTVGVEPPEIAVNPQTVHDIPCFAAYHTVGLSMGNNANSRLYNLRNAINAEVDRLSNNVNHRGELKS